VDPETGLFVSDAAAEDDILALPYSDPQSGRPQRLEDRQSSSHPHQVIPLPKRQETDTQTYLIPDLGGDALFVVSYSKEGKWKIWSKTSVESGWGPRHAVVNTVQGTPYLYLVNELVNKVSIHPLTFTSNGIPEISKPTEAYSTLPLSLQAYVPKDAFESIACAIILHTTPEGSQQLIITNRNASEEVRPEGDSIIIFPVSADGATLDAGGAQHLVGAGRHLRAAGVTTGEDGTAYLLVGARNGNGLTSYRQGRGEEGRWEEVARQVQLEGIELPISVDWI
jgi:6-phosphogluconolactonase (cycloisomerase 2 family)